jgi:hypothetical protein
LFIQATTSYHHDMATSKKPIGLLRTFAQHLNAMGPEAAKQILEMKFTRSELSQIRRLQEAWSDGRLSPPQKLELDSYVQMGNLLTLMHSKARQALKRAGRQSTRKIA